MRLPRKVIERVDDIASKNGLTRSEVLRQALTIYLSLLESVGDISGIRGLKIKPAEIGACLLYTSPSPRDRQKSRMPSSA